MYYEGRAIQRNAARYVPLRTTFGVAGLGTPYEELNDEASFIAVAPLWGGRTNIGERFDFDIAVGRGTHR